MKTGAKSDKNLTLQLQRPYGRLALAALLFAAAAAFFWHRAGTNDRGLIINGLIHLDPGGADVFYAVFCALCLAFTGLGLTSIYGLSRLKDFRLVLGKSTLKMPPGRYFSLPNEHVIPLAEILRVETHPPGAPRGLLVCTEDGSYGLDRAVLPEGWTIPELADRIIERAREASAGKQG